MESVLIKHLCIVSIVCLLSTFNGKADGHVVPQNSQLQLKTDDDKIEVYRADGEGGSWLQTVLVFARHSSNNRRTLHTQETPCNGSSNGAVNGQGQASECKDGYIQLVSKKCYFFSSLSKKWHEALAICESIGSTLAYPMNVIEDTVLVNYLRTHFEGIDGWWMGGSDKAKKKEWVWAHNKARINYTNWYISGRGYNYGQCLHYWYDGWQWKDRSCTDNYPFVCQQLNDTYSFRDQNFIFHWQTAFQYIQNLI